MATGLVPSTGTEPPGGATTAEALVAPIANMPDLAICSAKYPKEVQVCVCSIE